jgi:hypothetical protein
VGDAGRADLVDLAVVESRLRLFLLRAMSAIGRMK